MPFLFREIAKCAMGAWKLAACAAALSLMAACGAAPKTAASPTDANNSPQMAAPASRADDAPPAQQTGGFDGARAYQHLEKIVSFGPRPPGSDAIHREQEYLRSQLEGDGCAVEAQDFNASTPIGSIAMKNIVVKAPGRGSGVVLLLTHYDTTQRDANGSPMTNFVGADDGGSSTALMLELARLLCASEAKKKNPTIWMAFLDGEEAFVHWSDTDSTYGSRELAARLALSGDLKRIRAVILADMIGDRELDISRDSNSTPWLTDLVWTTAKRLGYGNYFLDRSTPILDDHLPFLRRGVPAVDIIDLDYPYWHTPRDTIDKVSAKSMAIVGHVILETIAELGKKIQ